MKGDLSRNTFDRAQHYSAVRLQQGRIVTDADWNEQADLTRYRAERQARDTIGACGAPIDGAGYALVAETNALAVHAVNANVAWIAAEDGALLQTGNAGADWSLIDLQTTAHLRGLQQVGGVGWVVGDGGVVRKTGNQGTTWVAQDAGTLANLRGVSVFDADHAWAVGDGGIVVATSDGGMTWRLAQTDAARLYAVHFIDEFVGVAAGQGGAIATTSDGGQTWLAAASGTTAHLRALAVFGTTHVWAAGQGGTILRSDDAGETWLPCNVPASSSTAATLTAIGFRDADEGWAAGEGGVVLHTTDGGANWALEDVGTSASFRGLSFFGNDPGWLVGDTSTALRIGTDGSDADDVLLPAINLSIEPGRCYVGGSLCELEARASYAHQPDGGAVERLEPGTAYLLYLDVWQRHLSALEAPAIREVALGGPDTATRARTVAQVRAMPLPQSSPFDWNCDSTLAAWDALVNAPRPRLSAQAEPQTAAANLCEIAATAGYRRLENQLYRVEVHQGGASPSFKWSRENGSIAYAVTSVSIDAAQQQTTVRVAARGRDANLDLAVHDRVELIDDDADLTSRAGVFFEYLNDGDDELELVLAGVPGGALGQDLSRHPVLRRWDHRPAVVGANVLPIVEGAWLELEDGVQVRFEPGGAYRPGDYWQIPARTITADVDWPRDDDGDPIAREPAGIADAYCRLGIVEVAHDGGLTVASDCRAFFPPLTAMEQLLYVSGDGQDAAPGALLPQPLALRVARGTVPVAGVGVRFEVETGDGSIAAEGAGPGGSAWQFETVTDVEGQAACDWTLGPAAASPARFQRVRASLLDANGQTLPGQLIVYCATASLTLQYVSGDGQQAAPGTTLPQPLEVRVANGVDGVAGITLLASVDAGGGSIVGATTLTTDAQGQASVPWQLGSGGPQRLTIELVDIDGQTLQRLSFNATAAVAASGGGCEITIGQGGQFPALDSDLLQQLIKQGGARVCLCFLPGTHDIEGLKGDGSGQTRLSLHGCGPASILQLADSFALNAFETLDIANLAIQGEREAGLLFERIGDLRLSNVQMDRSQEPAKTACLRVTSAQRVTIDGCQFVVQPTSVAAVFEDLTGDCLVTRNRFVGIVSFYGDPIDLGGSGKRIASPDFNRELAVRHATGASRPTLAVVAEKGPVSLLFDGNRLTQLLISQAMVDEVVNGGDGILPFQAASFSHNVFDAAPNYFVSGLTTIASNAFLLSQVVASPAGIPATYGEFLASAATVVGNTAADQKGVLEVAFQTRVEQAANAMQINVLQF